MKYNAISGFPELMPEEQVIFDNMLDIIENIYKLFGFIHIETPAVERKSLLLAKSGEEKEIYTLGRHHTQEEMPDKDGLALHFDLTVPLARYATSHMENLSFPFRRYQIQKVWRGERAQSGRYREFYQCDADILGKNDLNLTANVEILTAVATILEKLEVGNFIIKINHRLILAEIVKYFGVNENNIPAVFRIIDKIDKIGIDKTKEYLCEIDKQNNIRAEELIRFITYESSVDETIKHIEKMSVDNEKVTIGLNEIKYTVKNLKLSGVSEKNFKIDLKIVRGLDYYTGMVFETNLIDHTELGSICSGGRYDNLTESLGKKKLPGVGMSIGLSRLFLPLLKKNIWHKDKIIIGSDILVIPLTKEADSISFETAKLIRNRGKKTEIYAGDRSIKKSLKYANKQKINTVIIIGEDEMNNGTIKVKDMETGKETNIKLSDLKDKNLELTTIIVNE